MLVVKTKTILILMFSVFSIVFIASQFKNRNITLKAEENSNIFDKTLESSSLINQDYDYSYDTFEKEIMTYDRDRSATSEIETEPQNYNVKNNIEYVDFRKSIEKIEVKQTNSSNISLKQLLSVCVKAAEAGGLQLQSVRRNFDLREIWKIKPANSSDNPIAIGKRLSHEAMDYTLKKYFPNLQLVSRKHNGYKIAPYDEDIQLGNTSDEDDLVPTKNVLVWFDVLDPEYEFQQNYLEAVTTSVCVAVKGKPVIGVIHQPFDNFTKWGWVGHGESIDAYPVASEPVDVSRPITIIVPTARAAIVKMKARMAFGVQFSMSTINGAGFSFIQVAEGRADGYLHAFDIKKWKICAGDAIIKAADGEMKRLNNKEIDYGDPNRYILTKGFKATIEDLDLFEDFDSFESHERNS